MKSLGRKCHPTDITESSLISLFSTCATLALHFGILHDPIILYVQNVSLTLKKSYNATIFYIVEL